MRTVGNPECVGNDPHILSRDQCATIVQRVLGQVTGTGITELSLSSWWNGELRWGRNSITAMSDRRDIQLHIMRWTGDRMGQAVTNQIDDVSIEALVRTAELFDRSTSYQDLFPAPPSLTTPSPTIWSDATMAATAETRSRLSHLLVEGAEAKGLLSAGYLEIRGASSVRVNLSTEDVEQVRRQPMAQAVRQIADRIAYAAHTQARCSMTVRHPKGTGSGWAGLSGFDWSQIDPVALAERALDKCVQSVDPVRIEPGRYTVVLEPQAVADLVDLLMVMDAEPAPMLRETNERAIGPFWLGEDPSIGMSRSKLGLRVIDSRITIDHDPMAPQLGVLPRPGLAPITWIDKGVLKTLSYDRDYAAFKLGEKHPALARPGYRMSGGETSVTEMIAGTKRGLLVTRFSNLRMVDLPSLLATGVTRDGLWLIENGQITKAVKNMRITESPLFVLNNVEQLGVPVPVFRPVGNSFDIQLSPALVPPIKSNDFSFTSTTDAI